MIRNVVTKRPVMFVCAALAVGIVGALSFTPFSSQAGPSEDAANDLPYLRSERTLEFYRLNQSRPMDYRFWPGQYDPKIYAPSVPPQTQAHVVRLAQAPHPVRVAQARKPVEHPATLTIGKTIMSVLCRYVGGGSVLCRKTDVA